VTGGSSLELVHGGTAASAGLARAKLGYRNARQPGVGAHRRKRVVELFPFVVRERPSADVAEDQLPAPSDRLERSFGHAREAQLADAPVNLGFRDGHAGRAEGDQKCDVRIPPGDDRRRPAAVAERPDSHRGEPLISQVRDRRTRIVGAVEDRGFIRPLGATAAAPVIDQGGDVVVGEVPSEDAVVVALAGDRSVKQDDSSARLRRYEQRAPEAARRSPERHVAGFVSPRASAVRRRSDRLAARGQERAVLQWIQPYERVVLRVEVDGLAEQPVTQSRDQERTGADLPLAHEAAELRCRGDAVQEDVALLSVDGRPAVDRVTGDVRVDAQPAGVGFPVEVVIRLSKPVDRDVEEQPGREVEGAREAIAFSDEPHEEWFIASLPTQPAGPESRRIRHPESVVAPRAGSLRRTCGLCDLLTGRDGHKRLQPRSGRFVGQRRRTGEAAHGRQHVPGRSAERFSAAAMGGSPATRVVGLELRGSRGGVARGRGDRRRGDRGAP